MASTSRQQVQQLLATAAAACEDKKADDIRILALDPSESGLTDYFLICTGNSDRQCVAITDEIEIRLKREFGTYPTSVEGRRQGEWILMDYVDFIVHVFSAEKRAFYGLERLRKSATVLSVAELNEEVKSAIAATREKKVPSKSVKSASTKRKPASVKGEPASTKQKPASTKQKPASTKREPAAKSAKALKSAPASAAKKTPAKKAAASKPKKSASAAAKKSPSKKSAAPAKKPRSAK